MKHSPLDDGPSWGRILQNMNCIASSALLIAPSIFPSHVTGGGAGTFARSLLLLTPYVPAPQEGQAKPDNPPKLMLTVATPMGHPVITNADSKIGAFRAVMMKLS
jgi:hypothetical protein